MSLTPISHESCMSSEVVQLYEEIAAATLGVAKSVHERHPYLKKPNPTRLGRGYEEEFIEYIGWPA